MDRFIARENIKHLRNRLWSESDAGMRVGLQKLLVEEEDKFGACAEQLAELDRHIDDGQQRIARQRVLVATMQRDGSAGHALASSILDTMIDTQGLHERYRVQVLAAVERKRP
jgi:hypothetical protein